jgi:hypothetical protein
MSRQLRAAHGTMISAYIARAAVLGRFEIGASAANGNRGNRPFLDKTEFL